MRHHVQPFPVPAEDLAPHFVTLVRANLFLEAAFDCSQANSQCAVDGLLCVGVENDLVLSVLGEQAHGPSGQVGEQVGTGDVEIGKVCGVGFV